MKKIKVYLQYPWGISDSQYYRSLIENPPENIEYQNIRKREGMIIDKKKIALINYIKNQVFRDSLDKLNIPIPNIHKTPDGDYDLIHCAHCLSKNKNKPWIADFESSWQMWISGKGTKRGKKLVKKILLRPNCKKILLWTETTKEEILRKFPEIKNKIEVVGYAMALPEKKTVKKKEITLSFISRYFYKKGGLHALRVIDYLTKKYENVRGIFVAPAPKNILEKYKKNKKIKFFDLMPHEKLMNEIFPNSDIFIYPGYSDTYGFLFMEAMAFGIPVITVDGFARKEIIKDGKTGFVIDKIEEINRNIIGSKEEKVINEIIEKTEKLIENKELMEKMSKDCIEEIKNGRFSIKERNKKLGVIYEEALEN